MPKAKRTIDSSSDEGDDEWDGGSSEDEEDEEEYKPAAKQPKSKPAASPSKQQKAKPAAKKGPSKAGAAKERVQTEADKAADREAAKLRVAAVKADLVHEDREPAYDYSLLHPSRELRQAASKSSVDVVRNKGVAGKKKYLMMLPGRFAPVDGGTIGTIEKLDTANPELLLNWPGKGKLQLSGSLLRPKARYLTMRLSKGKVCGPWARCLSPTPTPTATSSRTPRAPQMLTEDVFDSMVVFPKAQWLQSSTEEAEGEDGAGAEDSLTPGAIPDTVHRVLHQKYSFAGGASGEGGSGAAAARSSANIRDALESAGHDSDAGSDAASDEAGAVGDVEVIDVDADEAGAPSSGKLPRRSTARQTKKSYVDAGSSAGEEDSEEEEEAPLGELRRVAASTKPAAKPRAKAEPDAKKPAAKASKPAKKPAAPSAKAPPKPKPAASSKAPKPKPKRKRDKDSSDEDSAADSDEDSEGFVGDWKPRKVDTPASGNSRGGSARAGRKTTSSYKEDSNSDDSMS